MGKGGEDYGKRENIGVESQDKDYYPAWSKDIKECEEHYQVNHEFGLSAAEVDKRRQIYGYNELEKHEGASIF